MCFDIKSWFVNLVKKMKKDNKTYNSTLISIIILVMNFAVL